MKAKILIILFLFPLITAFTLSPKTLMSDVDKHDGQQVEIMGEVEKIVKVIGPWEFGYYYEIQLYLSSDKNITIIAMTPQIPRRLIPGAVVKVHGKFHKSGKFARYDYNNYIEADKIVALEAA